MEHSNTVERNMENSNNVDQNTDHPNPVNVIDIDFKLYKPPKDDFIYRKISLPDSFYKLSTKEISLIIESRAKHLSDMENKPLMTQMMRDRELMLKQQKYPKCMIRVRFPDRFTAQFSFYSGDQCKKIFNI
jgi:tether containing UBX domain for GLUT4